MNLKFDLALSGGYSSQSQIVRVMSEHWFGNNMYCPNCGNPHIEHLINNSPAADFQCNNCGQIFELKSKKGCIGSKIVDGSYYSMIDRITSDSNPDLFLLQYSEDYSVVGLTLIPCFFFVPEIIEKRNPLAKSVKRTGWTGCNILYNKIPEQGKIYVIRDSVPVDSANVINSYSHIKQLRLSSAESRSWLIDVLNCVNSIPKREFTLSDVYKYTEFLHQKHKNNNNVEAKIRQQLQLLRDKGFIEFLDRGHYRKI